MFNFIFGNNNNNKKNTNAERKLHRYLKWRIHKLLLIPLQKLKASLDC